jgi:rhodanese-related sulfurtransferase
MTAVRLFLVGLFFIAVNSGFGQIINKNITVHQADSLIKARAGDKNFVILDIRTEMEYKKGHLANSFMINYLSWKEGKKKLWMLDRDKAYLVYCKTGVRSAAALKKMKKRKFREVYNMLGGIEDWMEEGYPVVDNRK